MVSTVKIFSEFLLIKLDRLSQGNTEIQYHNEFQKKKLLFIPTFSRIPEQTTPKKFPKRTYFHPRCLDTLELLFQQKRVGALSSSPLQLKNNNLMQSGTWKE
jgi:hypothetical protein